MAKTEWVQTGRFPPEYRAVVGGAECIVRTARNSGGLIEWEAVVVTDTEPVDESRHPTMWDARRHAEGVVATRRTA